MDEFALAFAGSGYKSEKGQLSLWLPAPGLLVARMSGQGDKAFAEPIVRGLGRALEGRGPSQLFFDVESMATYDSELRTLLTAAFLEKRQRISGLHVLVGSKLTAMGVGVANVVLGGIITSYSERAPFASALDQALTSLSVRGFSSDALSPGLVTGSG